MIEQLIPPANDADLRDLAELLIDAVESGAAVSFVAPLTLVRALDWWRQTLSSASSAAVFLVARDARGIVGTVQFHPAWAPNQPKRAEIVKLLVHRRSRRTGLGSRLMHAAEDAARNAGFTLLTLDAKRGGAAEALYRQLGWTHVGTIPDYAVDTDGTTPHDAVIFYKQLQAPQSPRPRDVVQAWVEAFNRADPDALADFYTEDAINHQVAESPVEGRAAIRQMFADGFAAANMVCIVENIFEDGQWAILEWKDPLGLRGCGFFQVVDGKIVFQRGYWDKLTFLRVHGTA